MRPYIERQSAIKQRIFTIPLALTLLLFITISVLDYTSGKVESHSLDWLIPIMIIIPVGWLIVSSELVTEIDRHGISYRLKPFHRKKYQINWREIENVEVRSYKPLREYGGWGYRFGFSGKTKAFSISGKTGISIDLKNGKHIMLGTLQPEQVKRALETWNNREH